MKNYNSKAFLSVKTYYNYSNASKLFTGIWSTALECNPIQFPCYKYSTCDILYFLISNVLGYIIFNKVLDILHPYAC